VEEEPADDDGAEGQASFSVVQAVLFIRLLFSRSLFLGRRGVFGA
jgi:hypothetical protein